MFDVNEATTEEIQERAKALNALAKAMEKKR